MNRVFMGWNRPALIVAAEYLVEKFARPGTFDLGNQIIALPGRRAVRRLQEILGQMAREAGQPLARPAVITVGDLPEQIFQSVRTPADPLVEQLAWAKALQRTEPGILKPVLSATPAEGDLAAWLSLGEVLARLHRDLAGEGLDFAAVARGGSEAKGFQETARWNGLAQVQKEYLRILDEVELSDRQMARLLAIKRGETSGDARIVLIGAVDLARSLRRTLDTVSDRATALIFAPPELADRFDRYGCVRPEAWQDAMVSFSEEQIEVVDDPAEQARAAVRALLALDRDDGSGERPLGDFPNSRAGVLAGDSPDFRGANMGQSPFPKPSTITIGVPDRQVLPYLAQQLDQCGIPARSSVGRPLSQTSPCRLLRVAAEHLEQRRFSTLAALVRHPAVEIWLDAQSLGADWLAQMDQYYLEHLPHRLSDDWSPPSRYAGLREACKAIERLLRPLEGEPRPLDHWGEAIKRLLDALYGSSTPAPTLPSSPEQSRRAGTPCLTLSDRDGDPRSGREGLTSPTEADQGIRAACDRIRDALRGQATIRTQMMPSVTGREALRLVLRQVGAETVSAPDHGAAVDLVGWLELPLDDAPVLIVTGFNEGVVPSALGADPFLPNPLRRGLGIEDTARRFARDAYASSALAASGRLLKVIAGRRTAEGDPLTPSRLLFACDQPTAARRVLRFFSSEEPPHSPILRDALETVPVLAERKRDCPLPTLRPGKERSAIDVPRPRPLAEPVTSMRVTEFRDYLACPYRYYLRHRLGLGSPSDSAVELDDAAFGRLAHEVLSEFGRDPIHRATDPEAIRAWLDGVLDRLAALRYGRVPLPAIRVQIEQLRLRLAAVARWQADWAAKGWRIEHVEASAAEGAALMVDGQPMLLRGRIDRIDVHRSGKRVLLDYKTSDTAKGPEQTHRRGGDWVDLQLPLYRHLLSGLGIRGGVELGYVVLPKDTGRAGHLLAGWSGAELRQADAVAADVVRKVRAEAFWPPASSPPAGFPEFAAICHDDQLSAVLAAAQGGNGT